MSVPAVALSGVVKRFGPHTAIAGLDLVMPRGESWCVVAPRGAGKTTLLRLIAGLLRPDAGTIRVLGIEDAQLIPAVIGYVPRGGGVYDDLTVAETVELHASLRNLPRSAIPGRVIEVLRRVGLDAAGDQRLAALSRGERYRAAMAAALVGQPRLLILDEPTAGLDPEARDHLLGLVERLAADGVSVLWSTAIAREAERCACVVFLKDGRLMAAGSPRELMTHLAGSRAATAAPPSLDDAFLDSLARDENGMPPALRGLTQDQTPAAAPVLDVRELTKAGLLRAVNLTVEAGESVALMGPNGAGKSLILRLVAGITASSGGMIRIAGVDLADRRAATARLGYVSSAEPHYPDLTPTQNLSFAASAHGLSRTRRRQRIDQLLGEFGLAAAADTRSGNLPPVLQWRVALAAALVHEPRLLLVDEPAVDLDPATRRLYWSDIAAVSRHGVGVLVATDLEEAAERCDRVIRLRDGWLVSPQAALSRGDDADSLQCPPG